MQPYNWKKTLLKGFKVFVYFAIPVLINAFTFHYPAIASLTVGALLTMGSDYLKKAVGVNLP